MSQLFPIQYTELTVSKDTINSVMKPY